MRTISDSVATSLDGYIADVKDGADWIRHDPDVDFAAIFSRFDTLLVGRRTFEGMVKAGQTSMPGMKIVVFSRRLNALEYPEIEIIAEGWEKRLAALRSASGKDIWLFGGGGLFRSLLDKNLVDEIELAIVPVLLGDGIPLLAATLNRSEWRLKSHHVFPKSGIVKVAYTRDS
jgi:dihydrofolate reductase